MPFSFGKTFPVPLPFSKEVKKSVDRPFEDIDLPENPAFQETRQSFQPIRQGLDSLAPPLPEGSVGFALSMALGAGIGGAVPLLANLGKAKKAVQLAILVKKKRKGRQQNKGSI